MAIDGTRKTIDELILLYDAEPELRDIIVEGQVDKALMSWFMSHYDLEVEPVVLSVYERIQMTDQEIEDEGYTAGARGGLCAAAALITSKLKDSDQRAVTFIIDRDWDWLGGVDTVPSAAVLRTDYAAMELYGWNSTVLEKFARVGIRAPKSVTGSRIMSALAPVLIQLFLARWVLHDSGYGLAMPLKIEKYCDLSKKVVKTRSLIAGAGGKAVANADVLTSKAVELLTSVPEDSRLAIHGHDIARLLFLYLKRYLPDAVRTADALELIWIACIEMQDLENEPMFEDLLERVAA
jgi:hypothetical protein